MGFRVQGAAFRVQGSDLSAVLKVDELCHREVLKNHLVQGLRVWGVGFTEMCSGSEAGSYLRLIDLVGCGVYLGSRV